MARYIDADKFEKEIRMEASESIADAVIRILDRQPTADVVEVKHGEWILHLDGSGTCKICNTHQKYIWDMDVWQNFCGHCGAKMDGKRK